LFSPSCVLERKAVQSHCAQVDKAENQHTFTRSTIITDNFKDQSPKTKDRFHLLIKSGTLICPAMIFFFASSTC
jgi:hypothetical protein